MRFNCGLTKEEKLKLRQDKLEAWVHSKCKWHKKFAWFPVRIRSGLCVWLEHYEAKYNTGYQYLTRSRRLIWHLEGLKVREINRD